MTERPNTKTSAGAVGPDLGEPGLGEPGLRETGAGGLANSLPKIIPFSSLVKCGDEVWIEHGGSLYRLRRTKQDKLILTK